MAISQNPINSLSFIGSIQGSNINVTVLTFILKIANLSKHLLTLLDMIEKDEMIGRNKISETIESLFKVLKV